jgi:hypothetical protein
MSLARPLRTWQRWLLKPIGWRTIALAVIGAVTMAYLSRWPRRTPVPWTVLREEFRWPWPALRPFTTPDKIFYAGAGCVAAFVFLFMLRSIARLLVPRNARRAHAIGRRFRLRRVVLSTAVIMSLCCIVFGWRQRIGQRWMVRALALNSPTRLLKTWYFRDPSQFSVEPPLRLSHEQARAVLTAGVANLPGAEQRMAALTLLVEGDGRYALPGLFQAAAREKDTALLGWELRLIGLWRVPGTASLLTSYLQDSRPAVRAAAADAIGILRHPSYAVYVSNSFWIVGPLTLDSDPPIPVDAIVSTARSGSPRRGWEEYDLLNEPPISIDGSVRPILERMMIDGATTEEREAAARTLVAWPPDGLQFRLAEWGVWISHNGHMVLPQSIIDEIPPFVHQTGNPLSEFDSYFRYPSVVTKPIVHLTANTALAADVEVHIREGRPWFAYPRPDDFGVGNESGKTEDSSLPLRQSGLSHWGTTSPPSPADEFDNAALKPLPDCREGYPWLSPHHRVYSSSGTAGGGLPIIYNLGLRWQSLIISPTLPAWMVPPALPADPKFQWWAALRDVPSCWVSNRGETERFLYYDGPTRAPVPVAVELRDANRRLHFIAAKKSENTPDREEAPKPHFQPLNQQPRKDLPEHEGLYMEVRAGVLRGQHVAIKTDAPVRLEPNLPLRGDAVIQRLRQMLLDYGLTALEAEGLIRAWTPQFFRTEGRRFALRMSPQDYDEQCPMQVRPRPTAVVRLGLVLTEFDGK